MEKTLASTREKRFDLIGCGTERFKTKQFFASASRGEESVDTVGLRRDRQGCQQPASQPAAEITCSPHEEIKRFDTECRFRFSFSCAEEKNSE